MFEKLERNDGTLLILHDFANYKASLDATTDMEALLGQAQGLDLGMTGSQVVDVHLQELRFKVPDSCGDWVNL